MSAIAVQCKCLTARPRHGEEARARSWAQSAGLAMLWGCRGWLLPCSLDTDTWWFRGWWRNKDQDPYWTLLALPQKLQSCSQGISSKTLHLKVTSSNFLKRCLLNKIYCNVLISINCTRTSHTMKVKTQKTVKEGENVRNGAESLVDECRRFKSS